MREMRLKKREITDQATLREIVEKSAVVRIGVADEDGIFVIPLNFGYDWTIKKTGEPEWKIYIHSAQKGRKADAFRKHPVVAIEMDIERGVITGEYSCAYSCSYQSIMGSGKIRLLTEKEEKLHGLEKIMEHMVPDADIRFETNMIEAADVYCIDVTSFTGKER